ncbi:MAG TPA: AMP-binding protein [Candidatus Polarisedimenticolaceae bacterium]|nr:AMP-binding protein [Candidatus Polarisedimenticolaceae bacterium]
MRAFLDRACARRPEAPFLRFRGSTWSYADLRAITDGVAAELLALGFAPGDRLAMRLPTSPAHVFLWLATAKAGIVSCPIAVDLAPPEVEATLAHLDPRGSIDPSGTLTIGGTRAGTLDALLASRRTLASVEPDGIATILTTSGTTGAPKAAMLSHRMAVLTGEGFTTWLGLGEGDRLFTCLPLSHVNARFYSCLGAIAAGASLAVEERFSASRFWAWMKESGATEVNVIGAMLRILLEREPSPEDRDHGLRLVYGALALGERDHLAFERRFGVKLVIGYGLTESTFGFIHPQGRPCDLASMGEPRGGTEVKLVDGEIWLRNPATFSGYFRDDAATREAVTDEGWLKTGDLATVDARGAYTFAGRKKLVIRRRGENLTPAEVESVLERHPAILEAAVVGVPSPVGEDDVQACIVFRPGLRAGEEELAAHCATHLAPFKVPTRWRVMDALPRTPTQRIAYHLLRGS